MAERRVIGRIDEIPPGTMKSVDLDGKCILLVRRGDTVTVIDGTCPHAGAPLAEGVLDGDRVICPWHKAAFSVIDGACLEPPAVDDLARVPVEIRDGEIVMLSGEAEADPRLFAIIGGGAAGTEAATMLRREGFAGRILLVDREGVLPYDRTILSKFVLSGEEAGEKSPLQDAQFFRRNRIERVGGVVTRLDPAARRITLGDGTELDYDAALLATGGAPRPAPFPGGDLGNVFVLRSQADADRIVLAARDARHVVVVGAGFIGMEAAGSLRERGLAVTVVAGEACPFAKPLGRAIGTALQRLHESKGVRFRLGSKVARLDGAGAVARVMLEDGSELDADLVLIGLGIEPALGFLSGVARREDGGLDVEPTLRVADGLYAAGDIAAFPLGGDGRRIRVEHWRVAQQQGRLAARNMIGAAQPCDAIPYFWTTHYMQRLDYLGHGSGEDEIAVRGDLEALDFIAYYSRDGRVTAAAGMGRDRDMAALLALMTRHPDWPADRLHPEASSPAAVLARLYSE
jgi:NADPH-dependent 2,4-dienoyl-CoA reductase/sulfur reductase-like enzyme/nitrite reductase/ring-hydroxylating ferredoxin subunit